MAKISDFITAKTIAAYWSVQTNVRIPYLLEKFFPNAKKLGLDLKYIKGSKGAPVVLSASTFDVPSLSISRTGFSEVTENMLYFKNSLPLKEQDRQDLIRVIGGGNQMEIDIIVKKVFADTDRLIEAASLRREKLRASALTTGAITIAENGVTQTVSYGLVSGQQATLLTTQKWDAPTTCDPIGDLNTWADNRELATGVRPTAVIMNRTTFNLVKAADLVKSAISAVAVLGLTTTALSTAKVIDYIRSETQLIVYVYQKGDASTGTLVPFIPDNKVIVLPDAPVGSTWFGVTPAEFEKTNDPTLNVEIVDTGVAIMHVLADKDPFVEQTIVSQICLPSFEGADGVFIATVA